MTTMVQYSEIAQMVKLILEQFLKQSFAGWKQYYMQCYVCNHTFLSSDSTNVTAEAVDSEFLLGYQFSCLGNL